MGKFEKRFKSALIDYPWGVTVVTASNREKDICYSSYKNVIVVIDSGMLFVYQVTQDGDGNETKTLIAASNHFTFKSNDENE